MRALNQIAASKRGARARPRQLAAVFLLPPAVIDLYATKGLEYLVVIGYLALLVAFWWLLTAVVRGRPRRVERPGFGWFSVPEDVWVHTGHTWLRPDHGRARVGVDDFAARLIGTPSRVRLPALGTRLERGAVLAQVERHGHWVEVRSPVAGEITQVNEALVRNPGGPWRDPFGAAWLLEVTPRRGHAALRGLLNGENARRWTDDASADLVARLPSAGGVVLQDGGEPVDGLAEAIAGERWPELVGELLGRAGARGR